MIRYQRMLQNSRITLISLGIFVASGLAWWDLLGERGSLSEITQRKAVVAPGWELPDAAGKMHRLSDYEGKSVILHFWASWCPPCLEELPRWREAAAADGGKHVWIAISIDPSWKDAHRVFPENSQGPIVSLLDASGKTPEVYGTFQYPETYVLDTEHRVVRKWGGAQSWQDPGVVQVLAEAAK